MSKIINISDASTPDEAFRKLSTLYWTRDNARAVTGWIILNLWMSRSMTRKQLESLYRLSNRHQDDDLKQFALARGILHAQTIRDE